MTINQFDLAFVVDTTSSMGNLIGIAQKQMVDMVDALATDGDIEMQLGVIAPTTAMPRFKQIQEVLAREFGHLAFDREVYSAWHNAVQPTVDQLAVELNATPPRVASSLSRLQSRGLLSA